MHYNNGKLETLYTVIDKNIIKRSLKKPSSIFKHQITHSLILILLLNKVHMVVMRASKN